MDKYFKETVCSQCINKGKNCRRIRKRTNKDGCTHIKCANYKRRSSEKTGEYKIAGFFLYRFLRSCSSKNIE